MGQTFFLFLRACLLVLWQRSSLAPAHTGSSGIDAPSSGEAKCIFVTLSPLLLAAWIKPSATQGQAGTCPPAPIEGVRCTLWGRRCGHIQMTSLRRATVPVFGSRVFRCKILSFPFPQRQGCLVKSCYVRRALHPKRPDQSFSEDFTGCHGDSVVCGGWTLFLY